MLMFECVKAVRSTDGGCAARQHPSAATGGGRRARRRGGFSTTGAHWFVCSRVTKVCMDSPSETAISGYARLLRSLRSNVVSPHTHSWRSPGSVGLQTDGVHPSNPQHRWWVRRPTTSERSDWRRAAYPPAGRAQHKQHKQDKQHPQYNQPNRLNQLIWLNRTKRSGKIAPPHWGNLTLFVQTPWRCPDDS